jgi:hypothetical protein
VSNSDVGTSPTDANSLTWLLSLTAVGLGFQPAIGWAALAAGDVRSIADVDFIVGQTDLTGAIIVEQTN